MSRPRLPWIVLLTALAVAAVLLLGPWWNLTAGVSPLLRPPGLNYGVAIRLGLVTLVMALVVVATMMWASRDAKDPDVGRGPVRRESEGAQH